MKLGIISDVHGNIEALKIVLEELEKAGVDQIISLGDQIGYFCYGDEVLELLQEKGVECIQGNHEVFFLEDKPCVECNELAQKSFEMLKQTISLENKKYLHSLKKKIVMEVDGLKICFIHGRPNDEIVGYFYPWSEDDEIDFKGYEGFDCIFMGHTHIAMSRVVKRVTKPNDKGVVLLNPGSVGQPRDDNRQPSYMIFDTITRKLLLKRADFEVKK